MCLPEQASEQQWAILVLVPGKLDQRDGPWGEVNVLFCKHAIHVLSCVCQTLPNLFNAMDSLLQLSLRAEFGC